MLDGVRTLATLGFARVIVVDDGSGADSRPLFDRLRAIDGVEVLPHAVPLGRGAALKTALNFGLCHLPDIAGFISADPQQHSARDILMVAGKLMAEPDAVVLGCRRLGSDAPANVRFANWTTRKLMHGLLGRAVSDPHPSLRGIPARLAAQVLEIEANGPEFELEMWIEGHRRGFHTSEVLIDPGPAATQFHPLLHSVKIYLTLLRFGSVSAMTALVDNLIFILARHYGGSVLVSQAISRSLAFVFSYTMVQRSVFASRRDSGATLPKYALLTLVSGAVSYGGIRLLSARTGLDPIPAKLIVEGLLFLVNFTIQRVFIFRPDAGPAEPREKSATPPGLIATVVLGVMVLAVAIEVHGFRTAPLFQQEIWEPVGVKRFLKYIGMFVGVSTPLLMLAPFTFPVFIAGLTTLGTVLAVGPMALAAVALFLISCGALGSRLLRLREDVAPESQLLATVLGASVWMLVMTAIARLPVNYPVVWAALLALPIAADPGGTLRRLQRNWQWLKNLKLGGFRERSAFALLVFLLIAHWFVALKPEVSADALAMHLAIPADISMHHRMTFEPSRFIWSVMPMAADFSYSIVHLLGGEYAAHLLDYAFLLLLLALLHVTIRRWVGRGTSFLLLALFASTPLVQLVTTSLFVENVLAVMVVAMLCALWRFGATGDRRFLYLSAMLGGAALNVKIGALAFVAMAIPCVAVEVARHWKSLGPRPVVVCALSAILLVGTALPPYAIAYVKTENPLFPFLYDKIRSPLISPDAGIKDERYKRPLTWNTLYDLTFLSDKTYEGQNGSFGFQYVALAPLGLAAMLLARRRGAASAAWVSLGAGVLIMATQPNARFVYACLPLLTIPFAALLSRLEEHWLLRAGLLGFAVFCAGMNIRFLPSASYYHRDFSLRLPFSRAEHERHRSAVNPTSDVIAHFNRMHVKSAVLMANDSAIAGLDGDIYENHWHQIHNFWKIRSMKSVPELIQLMQSWNVQYFIANKPGTGDEIKPAILREMLERCTEPLFVSGDIYLSQLQADCRPRVERQAILVPPGYYDDFDPALLFRGDWDKDRSFAEPERHTISFSSVTGSEVEVLFEGKALTYTYTKAPNRGIATLTVDGISQGEVDLYSAKIEWRTQQRFCCFTPGRHRAVIAVSGRANPRSSGNFVDLDSFTIE